MSPAERATTDRPLSQRLAEGTVLCAEGYLFELERRGYVKAGPFVPEVVLDFPDAVRQLHREFLRAGSDVMVAFTYYAHRDKLKVVNRENDLEEMNRQAVRLAREVASEGDALVAGNICNTWEYDPDNADESGAVVRAMYDEQVGWAAEEGVDFVLAETFGHLGEALIALEVIKSHGLEAVINFGSVQPHKTRDGYNYIEACKTLSDKGADVVGFNCSRGPEAIAPLMSELRRAVDGPLAAIPVPYRTTGGTPFMNLLDIQGGKAFPTALEPHTCTRFELAGFATEMQRLDVGLIGVCCGGAPHHVRAMAEALGRTVPASRYSPEMDLHPVRSSAPSAKEHDLAGWNG